MRVPAKLVALTANATVVHAGAVRAGLVRTDVVRAGAERAGLVRAGLVRAGVVRTGVALAGVVLVVLAGCAVPAPSSAPVATPTQTTCGTVTLANLPTTGNRADVAVVAYVLKTRLGCRVLTPDLTEAAAWQGFGRNTVDVVLQTSGNDDLKHTYIDNMKVAVEMGQTGNTGRAGWYVPPWLAAAHPDVTDYTTLNTLARKFQSATSGGKGEFLDLDAAHATRDEALIHNLGLDFTVVTAGSEAALIDAFTTAEADHTWLIGYFYQPQYLFADLKLARVSLPTYSPGCDSDLATIMCDYPPDDFDKVARAGFANSGSPAVSFVENFSWTNDDQDSVARDLVEGHLSGDAAAKKWVDAHPDAVNAWLRPPGSS